MELVDRYNTLKGKVVNRKKEFLEFLRMLETKTTWLTSPASTRFHLIGAALQNDRGLFVEAFDKGIFLVCPATLLFALRTIATLWKREKQNANAMEIARRGGALYDKFVGFYEQLENLGNCIRKTQECYDDSISKLKTGKGNLVRQVELIKELGARSSKALPDSSIQEDENILTEFGENDQ